MGASAGERVGATSGKPATSAAWAARLLTPPAALLRGFRPRDLRPDLLAGLTVAIVAIPQSIAYAAIAGLPPSYGLYSAAVASIVGSLWGSSRYLSTGPTNAASLLVLSALAPLVAVGTPEFLAAASIMAVLVGLLRVALGLARLGFLVNFASRAVLLGFTAGAAVLIGVGQLPSLLRLPGTLSPRIIDTVRTLVTRLGELHPVSLAFGVGTIAATLAANRLSRKLPGSLLALAGAAVVVALLGVDRLGVVVVGDVPRALPHLTDIPLSWLVDRNVLGPLLTGAMAVAALGLVEAISIARALARSSGERLDVDQEFVGQGLANVATGMLSGYTCSGSFTRSAVAFQAGARTRLAGVFAGAFVLAGVLLAGPYAAFLPRAALAGLLLLVAWKMVDLDGIRRVISISRTETAIMATTFAATLLLPLEFAVLSGVILSLAVYIYQSSMPTVHTVVPDEQFRHLVERDGAPQCPQLAVVSIRGALFFGATTHVEERLLTNFFENPGQHLLLLRMHGVTQCDLSGIEMLEALVRYYRGVGGDVFMVQVRPPVREVMRQSGFEVLLGADHFVAQEEAIDHLFEHHLDPAVCIYECEQRVFAECQALEKHRYDAALPTYAVRPERRLEHLSLAECEKLLAVEPSTLLVDVREREEFDRGHIAGSRLLPLRTLLAEAPTLPRDRPLLLLCRSGRRSTRGMLMLLDLGFERVYNLRGGILSWRAAGRPLEVR
jgi:sulfate permease, SulP family